MKKSATTSKVNTKSTPFATPKSVENKFKTKNYVPALEGRKSNGNVSQTTSKILGNNTYRNTYYNSLGVSD